MSGRGRAPKPADKKLGHATKPKSEYATTDLTAEPCPQPKLQGTKHRPETRRWWRTWTTCAQSKLFTASDWETLLQVVPLVDEYWRAPDVHKLSELRLQMAKFGATPEDRLRLRWVIKPPEPKSSTTSARKDDRLKLVKDAG